MGLVVQHLVVPVTKKFLQLRLKIWRQRPGGPQSSCAWCGFPTPPFDGSIDGIQGKSSERLLGVVGQASKGIVQSEATIIGAKHLHLFKSCLGV